MSDNQQPHNSPNEQSPKKTEILPTFLEDASQLPPNVRLIGQDAHGNLIYEEVPVQSQGDGSNDYVVPSAGGAGAAGAAGAGAGAAGTAGAAGAAAYGASYGGGYGAGYSGGYGGGCGGGNYGAGHYPGNPTPSNPNPGQPSRQNDDDGEKSNPVVIILSVLLVMLLIGIIALLGLIFIPNAPLNNVANGTVTSSVTETQSSTSTTKEDDDEDYDEDFADLVVRLPDGYVLSDPIEPVEGKSYRIVNPCDEVDDGDTCTSEGFAEAMQEAYIENGGLDGDMRFYAESPVTNESYPVLCEAQNGGKVLCVSGRDGSAAIIIDY